MPWRRLAALFTVASAQLVVDWTAKSTFDHEKGKPLTARCPLYSTVALHRTCLSNADPRRYLQPMTECVGCAVKAPENFVKPPGYGSSRGDLAPSLSYEVLAKAKQIYREDYLLYERLRRMDVGAGAGIIAIAASSARRSET